MNPEEYFNKLQNDLDAQFANLQQSLEAKLSNLTQEQHTIGKKQTYKVELNCNHHRILMFRANEEMCEECRKYIEEDEGSLSSLWENWEEDFGYTYEIDIMTNNSPFELVIYDEKGNKIYETKQANIEKDRVDPFKGIKDGNYLVANNFVKGSFWDGTFEANEFNPSKLYFKQSDELDNNFIISGKMALVYDLYYDGEPITLYFISENDVYNYDEYYFLNCSMKNKWSKIY